MYYLWEIPLLQATNYFPEINSCTWRIPATLILGLIALNGCFFFRTVQNVFFQITRQII